MKVPPIKISTIIPVYNAEKYLEKCLDSVLSQSLRDIEVICIDDCSTDGSYAILKEYEKKDERIKVLRNDKNIFAGPSRNRGIEAASGEYIHFLDADDYLCDDAYTAMYNRIEECGADILRAKALCIRASTKEVFNNPYYTFEMLDAPVINEAININTDIKSLLKISVVPWAGLYRRHFLVENNIRFPDLYCVNDRAFYIATIIAADRICFLDQYIVYHPIYIESSLIGQRHKHFECLFKSYEIIERLCKKLPLKQKQMILENEINNILKWEFKCSINKEYGVNIYEQTKQFLRKKNILYYNTEDHATTSYFQLLKTFFYDWGSIKKKKWLLFGAGALGVEGLEGLRQLGKVAEFFLDNDKGKHGAEICGLKVYSPDYLAEINMDEYFIFITSLYYKEIAEQLERLGYIEGKHYSCLINWGAILSSTQDNRTAGKD